jgi:Skp family chaperone for outer membrane proteins
LLIGAVLSAGVFAAVRGLNAQNRGLASGGRVACVDVIKIFNEYERQKDLEEEMRAIQDTTRNEAQRRMGQIDSLQATLDAMSATDPARVKRQREMLQLQLDYKNWSDLIQADMAREVGVWTRRTYDEVLEVIAGIAQREGYDVVLYREAPELMGFEPDALKNQIRGRKLVWADPGVDITQQVLDQLNTQYRAQPKTRMLQISPTLGP